MENLEKIYVDTRRSWNSTQTVIWAHVELHSTPPCQPPTHLDFLMRAKVLNDKIAARLHDLVLNIQKISRTQFCLISFWHVILLISLHCVLVFPSLFWFTLFTAFVSRLIHHIQLEKEHRAALILRQYTACLAQGALIVIDVSIFAADETSWKGN